MLTRGGSKESEEKGAKNPQQMKWLVLGRVFGKTRSWLKGQHMLGPGRLRYPETCHRTGEIQMPEVPERPAVAGFRGSCPMAAEFHSAAGVAGAGLSPQDRKLARIKQEIQAAKELQAQQYTEAQVGTLKPCSIDGANIARGWGLMATWWACVSTWSAPAVHQGPRPEQQDSSQSSPIDETEVANIFLALITVGSKYDALTLPTLLKLKSNSHTMNVAILKLSIQ